MATALERVCRLGSKHVEGCETAVTPSSHEDVLDASAPDSTVVRGFRSPRLEHRAILIDAARSAHRASSMLPELRAKYPTGTSLDRWLANLRQFSYLMREVDMVEEKLLEAAESLAQPRAEIQTLDTRVIRLALPLAEGVRARPLLLQWALCLQRYSALSESVALRILECLPVLAPVILSFLVNADTSAELVLFEPGLRTHLLVAAERLISFSSTDMSDELALPGFEERLSREIIQGSPPGGERRSFRQRVTARRH